MIRLRYSASLVTQGKHRFYTLTVPSEVLARTCFVTTREEDPIAGFQRVLDKSRAQQIADYIDSGLGTIPTSIVLSAQRDADLKMIGGGKTIEFSDTNKAFLVLDGQHRVYGFSLAKTSLRVPVVVYNALDRRDESRLFIDINTKQRPVPNELLLDIKKLAEYEDDTEQLLREIYDLFASNTGSPLFNLLSPFAKAGGKISHVTFNAAVKPLVPIFSESDPEKVYHAISAYLQAFLACVADAKLKPNVTNPIVFRAVLGLFPEVAQRVKDTHGADYTTTHFHQVLESVVPRIKQVWLNSPGNSARLLQDKLITVLKRTFTL